MKIIGICGSLRNESYNKKLLLYVEQVLPKDVAFETIDIAAPLYNDDLDISDELITKQQKIKEADAVIIVSPEYNYSIPGVLKNFLDWMSIEPEYPFDEKRVAIMSASPGMLGGGRMQYHLRQVLLCLNANVIKQPEVFIANVVDKFDGDQFMDERGKRAIQKMINVLIEQSK